MARSGTLALWLTSVWRRRGLAAWLMSPLALLYCALAAIRRKAYETGWLSVSEMPVPVIVVGNITVGGTGKTPLVIGLVENLARGGWCPGVVSRGYGGRASSWPRAVAADSDPQLVGDEPVIIARRANCPVMVGPDRVQAARALIEQGCNVVIADDGLQHYRLGRTIEIAVVDAVRRSGNGFCLPAGPLREPASRLDTVDMVVCNGTGARPGEYAMRLVLDRPVRLTSPDQVVDFDALQSRPVHAVAGIGNPQRFFADLVRCGLALHEHPYPDHWRFQSTDFDYEDGATILMTEKDAVKCLKFADERMWFVPASAQVDDAFFTRLLEMIPETHDRPKTA
jgi:tetraacyldisaccharide 4'-kinase